MRCIDDMVYRAIRARRARQTSKDDMLSLFLRAKHDDGTGMTNEQIRDEAVTLFVTSYETIGEALTWTSYLLSQHPAIDARFIAEVDDVLGGRLPTAEDLPKLAYTGMVLLTWLSANAVQQGDRSAFWPLLTNAFRDGAPSALDICVFFGIWLMPRRPRERLSGLFTGRSPG